MKADSKYYQLRNPRTKKWVLIDKQLGKIVRTAKEQFIGIEIKTKSTH